jgi:predicted  nucleic acid-binding Zn-ribbon protein
MSQQEAKLNKEIDKLRKDLANADQDQGKARDQIAVLLAKRSSIERKFQHLEKVSLDLHKGASQETTLKAQINMLKDELARVSQDHV